MAKRIMRMAAVGFVTFVVFQAVANMTIRAGFGVYNCIQKHKYNKKIKEGLKNGSIVEIDGEYYEVEVIPEDKKDEFKD